MMSLGRRMTLARKTLVRNVALLGGLAVLTVVALAGLLRLRSNIDTLSKEYAELRVVDRIARHVISAKALVAVGATDDAAGGGSAGDGDPVARELAAAIAEVDSFAAGQAQNVEGSASHEASEDAAIFAARSKLTDVLAARRPGVTPQLSRDQVIRHLDDAIAQLNQLINEADELVAKTQGRAARAVFDALVAITGCFSVIAIISVIISRHQYREVMGPLRRLREAATRMAKGRFTEALPTDGDREFADLAHEFNRMGRELDDLYRTLEQKVEQKSRELVRSERLASVGYLAAGVAHEINNPLGIMAGYAQLTLKRLRKDRGDPAAIDDVERTLGIIRDESFRCRQITEKLLSLIAPTGGIVGGDGTRGAAAGAARSTTVCLADIAEAVVGIVAAHERYRNRKVHTQFASPDRLFARADEVEVKQVLLNLVINALEATDDVVGQVWVHGERHDGTVRLIVRDNGCGMTPEVRDQVFEPFFTSRRNTDASGRAHGIGLGLSIAHAIVEGHGGRIWATSEGPGRGSEFVVELPAETAATAVAHAAVPPDPTASSRGASSR